MNNRLTKRILKDLYNIDSYNNCGLYMLIRIGDCPSLALCTLDTMIRIEEEGDKLYECKYCVYKDMLVCLHRIREDIKYVLNLR